jgi:hypothetical protein
MDGCNNWSSVPTARRWGWFATWPSRIDRACRRTPGSRGRCGAGGRCRRHALAHRVLGAPLPPRTNRMCDTSPNTLPPTPSIPSAHNPNISVAARDGRAVPFGLIFDNRIAHHLERPWAVSGRTEGAGSPRRTPGAFNTPGGALGRFGGRFGGASGSKRGRFGGRFGAALGSERGRFSQAWNIASRFILTGCRKTSLC